MLLHFCWIGDSYHYKYRTFLSGRDRHNCSQRSRIHYSLLLLLFLVIVTLPSQVIPSVVCIRKTKHPGLKHRPTIFYHQRYPQIVVPHMAGMKPHTEKNSVDLFQLLNLQIKRNNEVRGKIGFMGPLALVFEKIGDIDEFTDSWLVINDADICRFLKI